MMKTNSQKRILPLALSGGILICLICIYSGRSRSSTEHSQPTHIPYRADTRVMHSLRQTGDEWFK